MSNTQPAGDDAVQFRNRLISVLSHETKGLFANIFWLIEMIENNLADPDMLQQMLPELKSVAEKNLADYTGTLTWIKTQQEGFAPQIVKINVYDLFNRLHGFFQQQLAAKNQRLIFDGDRTTDFFSDEILVQLILKKILEKVLNLSFSEKMIIFKTAKAADNKEISIKIAGNDAETNEAALPEVFNNQINPITQMSEEMNMDLQFASDIASVLNGAIDVTSAINNDAAITLILPLN